MSLFCGGLPPPPLSRVAVGCLPPLPSEKSAFGLQKVGLQPPWTQKPLWPSNRDWTGSYLGPIWVFKKSENKSGPKMGPLGLKLGPNEAESTFGPILLPILSLNLVPHFGPYLGIIRPILYTHIWSHTWGACLLLASSMAKSLEEPTFAVVKV